LLNVPEKIRVSVGTAACLDLIDMKMDALPSTAYLMLYSKNKCIANCAFCAQARESNADISQLSRIKWPVFEINEVFDKIKNLDKRSSIKRICIQVLNYPNFFNDLYYVIKKLKEITDLPISISCQPMKKENLEKLQTLGIDRVGIPFDTATPELFYYIKGKGNKGPYKWEKHFEYLNNAIKILGPKRVTTHLIVGLGETEKEAVEFIQKFKNLGINSGLFAFTPLKGTKLENRKRPSIPTYRRIQLARYIIINKIGNFSNMKFNDKGQIIDFGIDNNRLNEIIKTGIPFQTSGCPNCNRPFYNERPGRKLYNYPKKLTQSQIEEVIKDLRVYS